MRGPGPAGSSAHMRGQSMQDAEEGVGASASGASGGCKLRISCREPNYILHKLLTASVPNSTSLVDIVIIHRIMVESIKEVTDTAWSRCSTGV